MTQKDRYIGQEILGGQFKILKKIGTGGMGSVYKAIQPEMNRMVAVKILHPKLKDRKDLSSRFRREARAMSHLTHPNTVNVMMYGELESKELYIIMEYLEGRNLNQAVRRDGPMALERAIPILTQVCGALEEAHQLGIVHRDLKPENIFLTNSGGLKDFPKVLDFGLAKVTERELRPGSIMLTQEGMVFGTPEFMSPEQAQGLTLDHRSDIYSLAVILYEALTGKLPFDARSSMEYIQLHVMRDPIPIDQRVPGLSFPPGLWDVIARALAKEPDGRYESAVAFADALLPFASGDDVRASSEAPLLSSGYPSSLPRSDGRGPSRTIQIDNPDEPPSATPGPPAASPPIAPPPATAAPQTLASAGHSGINPRTLVLVAALSVVVGVVLTLALFKLLS